MERLVVAVSVPGLGTRALAREEGFEGGCLPVPLGHRLCEAGRGSVLVTGVWKWNKAGKAPSRHLLRRGQERVGGLLKLEMEPK